MKNPPSEGLSLLKYVTIPKFNGSFSQSIHIWTKQVDQIMELVSIPHCMQGAFVMRYLEGASLEIVKNDLPLGKFIPNKEVVYKILMQNFGNKFNAMREIIRQHKDIGEIPSCYSCPESEGRLLWWSSLHERCAKHMQLIITAEESILGTSEAPPEEYILALKSILPMDILLRESFNSLENNKIFSTIKSRISDIKNASRVHILERSTHLCNDGNRFTSMITNNKQEQHQQQQQQQQHQHQQQQRSVLTTCRICKIKASNEGTELQPRHHKVTRNGFIIRETCPVLQELCSIKERIQFLRKNNICRSCLCLGVKTLTHPNDSCNYLSEKGLLFLQCKFPGCRLRSGFCDEHCYPGPDTSLSGPPVSTGVTTIRHLPETQMDNVRCEEDKGASSMCWTLHKDNHKSAIVNKEEVENTPEKSSKNEEISSRKSNTYKEKHYSSLSLCTSLAQALRMLVFIFCCLVTSFKQMKKEFYKSEKIPKKQSSETRGLKILDSQINRSEIDPG